MSGVEGLSLAMGALGLIPLVKMAYKGVKEAWKDWRIGRAQRLEASDSDASKLNDEIYNTSSIVNSRCTEYTLRFEFNFTQGDGKSFKY